MTDFILQCIDKFRVIYLYISQQKCTCKWVINFEYFIIIIINYNDSNSTIKSQEYDLHNDTQNRFFPRKYFTVFVNVLTCMYFNTQLCRQNINENEKYMQDIVYSSYYSSTGHFSDWIFVVMLPSFLYSYTCNGSWRIRKRLLSSCYLTGNLPATRVYPSSATGTRTRNCSPKYRTIVIVTFIT